MKTKAHTIYRLANGDRVPGVTTICGVLAKPALIEWANRIGLEGIEMRRYVDDKADIGTLAHDMVICSLMGEEADTSDYSANQIEQARQAFNSFSNWYKSHDVTLIDAEKELVSEEFKFGGKFDCYAKIDGVLTLLDFKTGSGIYPEHLIQVAGGYGILFNENLLQYGEVRILNIPRTKNENWGELVIGQEQINLNKAMFLALRQVYELQKKLKNEVVYPKKHEVTE